MLQELPPLPTPIDLDPATPGATLRLPPWVDRDLAEQFEGGRLLYAVTRASTPGGWKPRKATASGHVTTARRLGADGLHYRDALPPRDLLIAIQKDGAHVTRHPRSKDDKTFEMRHTLVRVTGTPLLLSLITGSGNELDEDLLQPATLAVAAVHRHYEPALLVAPELARLGRDFWSFRELVHAFQRIQDKYGRRAWMAGDDDEDDDDPDAMFLEPFTQKTEDRLVRAGRRGPAELRQFARRAEGGARTAAEEQLTLSGGRTEYYAGGPVLDGYARERSATPKGRRGPAWLFPDRPQDRPQDHEVTEALPQVFDAKGRPVDQIENLRWLCSVAGLPGWTDEHVLAAGLAERLFSNDARRRNDNPAAVFVTDGGAADRKLIRRLLGSNLEYYYRRVVPERLGDGGPDLEITGAPFILGHAAYQRIRKRWTGDLRARVDAHLFTGAKVIVDGHLSGVLEGHTGPDGTVYYVVLVPGSTRHLGTREDPIPPIPQERLLEQILETLGALNASLYPPPDDTPDAVALLERAIATRAAEIAEIEAAQEARWTDLDPGNRNRAHRDDAFQAKLQAVYGGQAQVLKGKQAVQHDDEERLRALRDGHNLRGIPVADLFQLAAVIDDPLDRSLRFPLLAALEDPIQVRRPLGGRGYHPDKPAWLGFSFTMHDPDVGSRQAWVETDYATSYQLRGRARTREIVVALAHGHPIAEQGVCLVDWRPALRAALGGRPPVVLNMDDSWLLEVTMAVNHPLLVPDGESPAGATGSAGRTAADPEVLTGPPLDDEGLRRLAAERGWPLALLERVRALDVDGTRSTGRVLYNRAPATAALYAAARRRGRIVVQAQDRRLIGTPRTRPDWDVEADAPALRPCARCGSGRIYPSQLRQVTGGLCVACHHDRADVAWARRYDRFLEG